MKTVIFVSDSNLDIYADKALVGREAYRSFLEYLIQFDLSINETLLYNEKDLRTIEAIAVSDTTVKVLTIGSIAKKAMEEFSIPFYELPPIDKAPDTQSLDFDIKIRGAREFINDYRNH